MIDYEAARAVALVVETGSFERAARALHVTPSAVSQRVKLLEERLGTVLIERGTPCTATEKGAWLCRHMEHVGMLEQELVEHLPGMGGTDTPTRRVTLSIATNADSLATWFLPAVVAFSEQSDYLVNVTIDGQDHTAEWLQRGRVLAAVTGRGKPVQGCQVTALGTLRFVAVASPQYCARFFAAGVTLEALAQAPALTFNQKDLLQHDWISRTFGSDLIFPTHWMPSSESFVAATLSGMGWGMLPIQFAREPLAAGRLIELRPGTAFDVPLYWQINRLAAGRLTGLTQAVVEAARHGLEPRI